METMSNRAVLFLISVFVVLASLASVVWLVASGQALSVDGLFLLLTCLLLALAFALYLMFTIRRAMDELKPAPAGKPGTPKTATPSSE